MSMDVQTSMRLPATLLERADALIEALQSDPSLSMMGKMTRSKVLRLALNEGLLALEERKGQGQAPKPRAQLIRARAQEDPSPAHTPDKKSVSQSYSHSPPAVVTMEED